MRCTRWRISERVMIKGEPQDVAVMASRPLSRSQRKYEKRAWQIDSPRRDDRDVQEEEPGHIQAHAHEKSRIYRLIQHSHINSVAAHYSTSIHPV